MAEVSNIEWTDSTFNPWIGCTRVSPACDDCYAARSTPARTLGVAWGAGQPRRLTSHANWKLPERWERQHAEFFAQHGRRRRVFCASLADVFDNEVDPAWRSNLLRLILDTPHLDWLVCTKRVGNVPEMLREIAGDLQLRAHRAWTGRLPTNVWLGATVVDQAEADRDIPKLLAVPARVRFLSIEPMLGPIDLTSIPRSMASGLMRPLDGRFNRVDWIICGGESGPKARPMHPDWARSLRDQCAAAGVPFLFKQWGEWAPGHKEYGNELPFDLRTGSTGFEWYTGEVMTCKTLRVGKKAAGRLLDGVEHNGFPEVAHG